MRTWGRITNANGTKTWVEVSTDANGFNDAVALTWLCQVLQLSINESPFYADWGVPARQAVRQGVPPDLYVAKVQQRFAPYFASLVITRNGTDGNGNPVYNVFIITHQGAQLAVTVGAPE